MSTPTISKPLAPQKNALLFEETLPERIERIAFENASYPDSYLTTEPEYEHFWDDQQTGMIGFILHRKYLHIIGGLIAPPHRREELLAQFCDYLDRHDLVGAFYSIAEQDVPLFRRYGFQVSKFGENTTIDLQAHSWEGKSFSWVRRQTNYVARQGMMAREIFLQEMNNRERSQVFEKLKQIDNDHLAGRVLSHHINLLEGKLYEEHFYRRRLFVAHDAATPDDWQGYVACTPMNAGRSWATEMYRSSHHSVRGVVPFLIVHVIDKMKREGVKQVSLCMVPAINCDSPLQDDSRLVRFLLGQWATRFNFVFNVQGLYHFKSRFRPQFSPAYLCVRSAATPSSVFSFMQCTGVFDLSWKNLFRKS